MESTLPTLSIVIPLYNEEKVFEYLIQRLDKIISQSPNKIEIVLVNDGSTDNTVKLITEKTSLNSNYVGVLLSRNFGHQIAVTAGLSISKASEAIMVIDGDLQDPPELVFDFYAKLNEGYDVVYAVRKNRKEGIFKKSAYFIFYRLLNSITNIDLPLDSGDFCMMSRRVVDVMNNMKEESRYLRGMRVWAGFKQIGYEYERASRAAGEPKYNFKMLLNLAYTGIFNFSDFPIKLITRLGTLGIISSIIYLIYNIIIRLSTDIVPSGFTALVFLIILFGSIQFLFLGILGEYIIRIFFQSKTRPLFIIDKILSSNKIHKNNG